MNHRLPTAVACFLLVCALLPLTARAEVNVKAIIGTDVVQLKERPDIDSATIVEIAGGEAVLIVLCLRNPDTSLGAQGRWCLVRYRGVEGWLSEAVLDTTDPRAETSYRDIPSLAKESERLGRLRESHSLEATERLSSLIIDQIEHNFTREQIIASGQLSGTLISTFSDRIEALVYLHRFTDAQETYGYVIKTYPDIQLEGDVTSPQELLQPFVVFMDGYSTAPLFKNPNVPMKKLRTALEKRDLPLVSALAVPGIFEVWVAYTDWVVKLGDQRLDGQEWLSKSWETPWTIKEVSKRTDSAGNLAGYCIVTEPWDLNYYEIRVNRVDFCIDRLPDGTFAFNYLILYTEPVQ
jgi:hypothetical protein